MLDTKRVILEQGNNEAYKRFTLEQSRQENQESRTPKWDELKTKTVERFADKANLFTDSFKSSLRTLLFILMGALLFFLICGK